MTPLAMANAGETGVIQEVTGRDEMRRHLAELGLSVGERVTVVSEAGGGMVLAVNENQIPLDKTVAMRILI